MKLVVEPTISKRGDIEDIPSSYNPDQRVKDRLKDITRDYGTGEYIRNQPYEEFNDRDLIEYSNECQRKFNGYVPSRSSNPEESWRAQVVRPYTRSKVISIAAHVTSNIMYPNVVAQNERDEEDKDAADVMRDLMKWSNQQSKYDRTFVYGILSALVNPAVIFHLGYADVMRKIKEIVKSGEWKEKEIRDEIYSGFFNYLVPVDELFIGDFYEHDIQKQPFLIWRRVIDYSHAKAKYGHYEEFEKYVRPGLRIFYQDDQDTFYEQYDEGLGQNKVEEVVYYNRYADLELTLVNGVLLCDPDQPIKRNDKKYPFVKGGYEPIDEGRCFYYKSLVDKISGDQDVIDTLYNMVIDGSFLKLMPPLAIYGDEDVDTAVIIPGSATAFSNESKIEPINIGTDLNAGLSVLREVEASADQNSQDPLQSGQATKGTQTAFEISKLEQNARTVLGLFGKMVAFMVEDFGQMRLNDILQYMTVGEVMETTATANRMKFRNFIVADKMINGKKKSRRIEFETDLEDMDKETAEQRSFELLDRIGDVDNDQEIIQVNPKVFRSLKYTARIEPDFSPAQSEAVKRALNLELFDRAIQLPFADHQQIFRDLLLGSYDATRDDPDKYIKKEPPAPMPGQAGGEMGTSKVVQQLAGSPEMSVPQLAQ